MGLRSALYFQGIVLFFDHVSGYSWWGGGEVLDFCRTLCRRAPPDQGLLRLCLSEKIYLKVFPGNSEKAETEYKGFTFSLQINFLEDMSLFVTYLLANSFDISSSVRPLV